MATVLVAGRSSHVYVCMVVACLLAIGGTNCLVVVLPSEIALIRLLSF